VSGKGILFDFDGTLVPNLDLADMRRQIAEMAAAAGVPDDVHAGLYIVEIIEASQAWLLEQHGGEASLSNQYAADSHQCIHDIDMQAGRELNMRCIGVLTGSNDTEALGAAGADEVLADYRGLVNLLT